MIGLGPAGERPRGCRRCGSGENRQGLAAARPRGSSFSGGTGATGAAAALARGRVQPQSSPALLQHRCRGRSDVPRSLCISRLQGRIILCFPGGFAPGGRGFRLGWAVIGNEEILWWRRLPPWLCVVWRQRCRRRGLPCPTAFPSRRGGRGFGLFEQNWLVSQGRSFFKKELPAVYGIYFLIS